MVFGGDCTDTGKITGGNSNEDSATPTLRKSTSKRKVPERYGLDIDPDSLFPSSSASSYARGYHKIKRVLGQ